MVQANTLLNLPSIRANILSQLVEIDLTGVSHYTLDILWCEERGSGAVPGISPPT